MGNRAVVYCLAANIAANCYVTRAIAHLAIGRASKNVYVGQHQKKDRAMPLNSSAIRLVF